MLIFLFSRMAQGQYLVNVEEFVEYGKCHAIIEAELQGNAAPFNVKIYFKHNGDYYILYEESGLQTGDLFGYLPYYRHNDLKIEIQDVTGCNYEEFIRYNCGCETFSLEIDDRAIFNPSTCFSNDGIFSMRYPITKGGTGPFTFEWDHPGIIDEVYDFKGFNEGVHTLTVTGSNGCSASTQIEFVGQNSPKVHDYEIHPDCAFSPVGSISFVTDAGERVSSHVEITWSSEVEIAEQETDDYGGYSHIINLTEGRYCATVFVPITECERTHCYDVGRHDYISELNIDRGASEMSIEKTCYGQNKGSIQIYAAGGARFNEVMYVKNGELLPEASFDYEFELTGENIDTIRNNTGFFENLGEGYYTAKTSDYCGNTSTMSFYMPSYPEITADFNVVIGCKNKSSLTINSIQGGSEQTDYSLSNYTIDWSHGLNQNSVVNNDLSEDLYAFTITNIHTGCTEDFEVFVDNYPEPILEIVQAENTCVIPDFFDTEGLEIPIDNIVGKHGSLEYRVRWEDAPNTHPDEIYHEGTMSFEDDIIELSWVFDGNPVAYNDWYLDITNYFRTLGDQFSSHFAIYIKDKNGCEAQASISMQNEIEVSPVIDHSYEIPCRLEFSCPGQGDSFLSLPIDPTCCYYNSCDFECMCIYPESPSLVKNWAITDGYTIPFPPKDEWLNQDEDFGCSSLPSGIVHNQCDWDIVQGNGSTPPSCNMSFGEFNDAMSTYYGIEFEFSVYLKDTSAVESFYFGILEYINPNKLNAELKSYKIDVDEPNETILDDPEAINIGRIIENPNNGLHRITFADLFGYSEDCGTSHTVFSVQIGDDIKYFYVRVKCPSGDEGYYCKPLGNVSTRSNPKDEKKAIEGKYQLFPNPANGSFFIEQISKPRFTEIGIYDINGKLILESYMTENIKGFNANLFIPGVYFVKLKNDLGTFYEKIIISR